MPAVFPSTIDVSTLNGQNGFVINGGGGPKSVSCAGDVNNDGVVDLITGLSIINSSTGVGYVIFGNSGIGGSGALNVDSLSGMNGFVITGFPASGWGGYSVSNAGDINKDNITDLIIGAPGVNSFVGASYVILGGAGIGNSGTLSVANLNGTNGFNVTGFLADAWVGRSVSSVGDINQDGVADLIIGAPQASSEAGAGYVILGHAEIGNSGTLSARSLSGTDGFNITGFPMGAEGCFSVSSAGDINNDGVVDLIIGARTAFTISGVVYVIFGSPGIGDSGTLNVTNLNGTNGFKITGFPTNALGVWLVSGAGDVNNDNVTDLIIGAPYTNSTTGAVYVIFGGAGIGSSGTLSVMSLNGANGFNITGFSSNAFGGCAVSSVQDLNKDGVADLIIGARNVNSNAGAVYVVFGSPGIGSSGTLSVTSLNGINGFNITGFPPSAWGGHYVSSAGDINDDGTADLIIEAGGIGREYVIFGDDCSLDLINNQLAIRRGDIQLLNATNLNATDTKNNPAAIQFVITNLQRGEFTLVSNPSQAITNFTQLQVNAQQVQFEHDGSFNLAPSYDVSVYHRTGFAYVPPAPAQVNYFPITPSLGNNRLTISQGQTVVLTPNELNATDPIDNITHLIFNISNAENGYFTPVNNSAISLTQFTQGNVSSGNIQFIQDGLSDAPSYAVTVIDSYGFTDGPVLASITFNSYPQLLNNRLNINQGQRVILNSADLSAQDRETSSDNLIFTASPIQHGQFEDVNSPGVAITTFLQQKITESSIAFVQDGSSHSPFYNMSVNDGVLSTTPMPVSVNFHANPPQVITSNNNTAQNAAIAAGISGMAVLAFLGVRYCLNRKAKKDLEGFFTSDASAIEKEQKQINRKVVSLVANTIFERIKTTNILSYRSEGDTRDYLLAIERMIWRLDEMRISLDFDEMGIKDKEFLLNEIVQKTRIYTLPKESYCAKAISFFRAEITPNQLDNKVDDIAFAVKETVTKSRSNLILEPGAQQKLSIARRLSDTNPTEMDDIQLVRVK